MILRILLQFQTVSVGATNAADQEDDLCLILGTPFGTKVIWLITTTAVVHYTDNGSVTM